MADTDTQNENSTPLLLPPPSADNGAETRRLDAGTGTAVKLDELGPMVVNSDGTLSRIANWAALTPAEQERTLRVLSARNKVRLANEERKAREGDTASEPAGERLSLAKEP